jgi:D-alanine-D-alanine ligase-like ATP-grasp enzyme
MTHPAKKGQTQPDTAKKTPTQGHPTDVSARVYPQADTLSALVSPAPGVVVLYSAAGEPAPAASGDVLADLETTAVAKKVAQILREHTDLQVHLLPAAQRVAEKLGPYPPDRYVIFNLFEGLDNLVGADGTALPDQEAPTAFALEALGYRFTGASGRALALALNKAETKQVLAAGGVCTPAWRVFARADEVSASALRDLHFPLIVKPVAEDSSLAIDDHAVVTGVDSLRERVRYVVDGYHQSALAEEFIDGREISAGIWGDPPEVLPLSEVDLSVYDDPTRRIVTFAAKWDEGSFDYVHTPVTCPATLPEALAMRIRGTALRAWELVAGHLGYGRVDMRIQGDRVYVIEVNPNPSIAADAGFARQARVAGLDYAHMILKILSLVMEVPLADHSPR